MTQRLLAPADAGEANIAGTTYTPDADGYVTVEVAEHVSILQSLGYGVEPTLGERLAAAGAITDLSGAPASLEAHEAIPAREAYPAVFAALALVGIELDPAAISFEVLDQLEGELQSGQIVIGRRSTADFEIGAEDFPFTAAALAAKGIGLEAGPEAVFGAIEELFEPFKAFDPNGDFRPGGPAPDADAAQDQAETDEARAQREAEEAQLQAERDAALDADTGKSADELEAAHSGPELRDRLSWLGVTVPSGMTKAKVAAALFDELAKRAEAKASGAGTVEA